MILDRVLDTELLEDSIFHATDLFYKEFEHLSKYKTVYH